MRIASLALGAILSGVLVACGGDDTTAPPVTSFTGTWQLAKDEYVSVANSAQKVDLVAEGWTGTITLDAAGTFTGVLNEPGVGPQTISGTWNASGDVFTITQAGSSGNSQFAYTLSTSQLTLTGADADYDFNADGTPEAAKWNLTLTRP